MKRCEICNDTDAVYYTYTIDDFTLTIDEIIDKEIEIERLLTETEAAVYLTGVMLKDSTKKAANELFGYDKETTYTSEDLKKYDAMLGYGKASHDNFWKDSRRCGSQQEIKAAYKIDEDTAKECVDFGQMAKDLVEEDPVAEVVKHGDSRYLMSHLKSTSQSLPYVLTFINDKGEFDPTPFKDMVGTIKITMRKGTSEIVWYTAKRNIRIVPNTIEIRNRNGTVQMILTKDTFFLMFDNIIFEDQQ
jgi:hypothetical protein